MVLGKNVECSVDSIQWRKQVVAAKQNGDKPAILRALMMVLRHARLQEVVALVKEILKTEQELVVADGFSRGFSLWWIWAIPLIILYILMIFFSWGFVAACFVAWKRIVK